MKRKIIRIDEDKCNGCGLCIPDCPEGALQMINSKARLVSDLFCDGLGACMGSCPQGAIEIEERDAEPYDERKVMEYIIPQGTDVIRAHLEHLDEHGESEFLRQAMEVLEQKKISVPGPVREPAAAGPQGCSCPGSREADMSGSGMEEGAGSSREQRQSELRQWPVQLKLLNPAAPYFDHADLLVTADCVPVALGDFHGRFLKNKTVIMFCPKLDPYVDEYTEKLAAIFSMHQINTVSIVRMEVPCCGGVGVIVQRALQAAGINMQVSEYVIGINGQLKQERI